MMNKRILCVLGMFLVSIFVAGAEPVTPEATVRTMVDKVLATLDREGLGTDGKMDAIINIITPVFDFPLMAKLTMGRTYWPQLSKEQQQEFTDLFVEKLRKVYTKQVDNFSGEKVVFEEARQVGSKVHLSSYVLSKGDRVSILYKLYKSGGSWRIYDLEIQDVSMIRSYNAQFVPVIRDRSPEALLQELRDSITETTTE